MMLQQKHTEGTGIKDPLSTSLVGSFVIGEIGVEEVGIDLLGSNYSRWWQNSYDGILRRENAQNARSTAEFGGVAA